MVTMLIRNARAFGAKFNVYAISVRDGLEKFVGGGNRRWIRVLGVVNSLGLGKSTRRELPYSRSQKMLLKELATLTKVDLFRRV